jgi:hypothetical protein
VVPPDGSATEELAALDGGARWVKAFNTTFAIPLTGGEVVGHKLDVLIAGDAPSRSSPDVVRRGRARERSRMSEDPGVGQGFHGREGRAQARC